MKSYENECRHYHKLNEIVKYNGVVLFGSTFARNMPVSELRQSFGLECNIYNRSIPELSVFDAASVLADCVLDLYPDKVLLQLGETDLEQGKVSMDEIITEYENVIMQLKKSMKTSQIVVISVCEENDTLPSREFNKKLEKMAARQKCRFADISAAEKSETPDMKAFSLLQYYFWDHISDGNVLSMIFA